MVQVKMEEQQAAEAAEAVFPVVLEIVEGLIFSEANPIRLGILVEEGTAKVRHPRF